MVHNWTTQEHENIKQFVSVIMIPSHVKDDAMHFKRDEDWVGL
jgi:hypothetical protein